MYLIVNIFSLGYLYVYFSNENFSKKIKVMVSRSILLMKHFCSRIWNQNEMCDSTTSNAALIQHNNNNNSNNNSNNNNNNKITKTTTTTTTTKNTDNNQIILSRNILLKEFQINKKETIDFCYVPCS